MSNEKNKKIICVLNGGLGNQFFQYAFAKCISLQSNRELYFISKEIKNHTNDYELDFDIKNNLNSFQNKINLLSLIGINTKRSNFVINFFYLLIRVLIFISKKILKTTELNKILFIELINEKSNKFDSSILNSCLNSKSKFLFISGYWQSRKYFQNKEEEIFSIISINESKKNNFKSMSKIIKNTNSVAICIRIYEELPQTNKNTSIDKNTMGGIPNIDFYNKAIDAIKTKIKNPTFFVFSAKKYNFFNKLKLEQNTYYLNNDNGYSGTIDNLWLISQCKSKILSYSSFYWLGAWLSDMENQSQLVYRPLELERVNYRNTYYSENWEKIKY